MDNYFDFSLKNCMDYMANGMEMSLLEPEERKEVEFIWNLIPAEDKQGITEEDVLLVLDAMDDFLEEVGLLHVDEETGEVEYEDGEVDETAQMEYVAEAAKEQQSRLSMVQIQLIMDGEFQYGLQEGWYEEELRIKNYELRGRML